ncbi:MAG TPA: hypothetical protein VHS58_02410 [Acetobacteraceae bacterium]|nr:hypothetical protein [Acetobacteraceae bacterium]
MFAPLFKIPRAKIASHSVRNRAPTSKDLWHRPHDGAASPAPGPRVLHQFGRVWVDAEPSSGSAARDEEPTEALEKRIERSPSDAGAPRPASLGMLRHVGDRDGAFVTGPPVATNLGAVRAGGGAAAAGFTAWPAGFKAPDFDFNTHTGAGVGAGSELNWTADPILTTAAFEGVANSFYTSAGKYKTGEKEGGKDVSWIFSPVIASLIKTGEQEHCDDHAAAYSISLKEAESVLKAHVVGHTFGPAASSSDAEKLVLKTIDRNLTHKALGTDKAKWAAIYTTLYQKTGTRDTSQWHTLWTGPRTETATDVTYEIVKGASQIGSHSSASIIKY